MQTGLRKILYWSRSSSRISTLLFIIALHITSCNRGPNDPGWDYFPDMAYSPSYRTWSENPVLENGKTMLPPVEGTVPRNMIPFQYERTDEDRIRAGHELQNPLASDGADIERGRKVYSVYCMNCHGESGDGLGHLFTSGRYLVPPSSLVDDNARVLSDGMIYHTISLGLGVMSEHASLILPEDRWKTILYIRQELQGVRFELHDVEFELPGRTD